jgi:hypothetical protein
MEETCIKALLFDPTLIYFIDKAFRGHEIACLNTDDFSNTDFKQAFELIKQGLEQDQAEPLTYIREHMPDALADTLAENPMEEPYPDWRLQPSAPILESLLKQFIRLRRIRVDEGLDQIIFLQTQETPQEGEALVNFMKLVKEFAQARSNLDEALKQPFSQEKPKQR